MPFPCRVLDISNLVTHSSLFRRETGESALTWDRDATSDASVPQARDDVLLNLAWLDLWRELTSVRKIQNEAGKCSIPSTVRGNPILTTRCRVAGEVKDLQSSCGPHLVAALFSAWSPPGLLPGPHRRL